MKTSVNSVVIIVIMVFTIMMMVLMTSCGSEKTAHETWILVSKCSNQAEIDMSKVKERLIDDCRVGNNKVYLMSVEGTPVITHTYSIPEQSVLLLPSQKRKNAESYASEILSDVSEIIPSTPEVDYGMALYTVGKSADKNAAVDIYIIGSGLSSTGPLDFHVGFEPEKVLKQVRKNDAVPDFANNVEQVYFTGLAQVDDPQKEITPTAINAMEEIYRSLFTEAGVDPESVTIELGGKLSSNNKGKSRPSVSVIDVPSVFSNVNILNDEVFGSFIPDTSEFIDESKAKSTAFSLAEQINSQSTDYIVAGFTAGDSDNKECLELSQKRANAVCDLLIQAGVSKERLTPLGCGAGYKCDYTVRGLGSGPTAQVNRITILFDKDSDEGKDILKKYGKT